MYSILIESLLLRAIFVAYILGDISHLEMGFGLVSMKPVENRFSHQYV